MSRRDSRSSPSLAIALLLVWARVAIADPVPEKKIPRKPSVAWSVISGLATALVPMAIGGSMMPSTDLPTRQAGIYVIQAGLALSPFVSHGVSGEWGRGAVFSLPGLASIGGMAGIFAAAPDVTAQGDPDSRVPFAILISASVVGAAAGLIDSFLAGERWNKRHLVLAPAVARGQAGITLGGNF